jgi:CubicO group peptidase (beta-lactamase class C family)
MPGNEAEHVSRPSTLINLLTHTSGAGDGFTP